MRVLLIHHPSDAGFAADLVEAMGRHRFEARTEADGCDFALVLASKAALRDGLGEAPAKALAAGLRVVPVVLGDDALPPRFPVHAKHVPRAADVADLMRLLEDHRKVAPQKIADSKQELFGYGVLLALLSRGAP